MLSKFNILIATALAAGTPAAASEIAFYCDIDQGYDCRNNQCRPVEQTVYPARYRFKLDLTRMTGSFRSCPGNDCGGSWALTLTKMADGTIHASHGPETFAFHDQGATYRYVWRATVPGESEGRHKGRCFR